MRKFLLLFGVMSLWLSGSAQCPPGSPLSTPYYENFDTLAAGQSGSSFTNCYVATTTSDPNWESEIGTTTSSYTGPSNDYSGSGTYIYMETSSGSTGDTAGFISPEISLSGVTTPELTFYYHMYGATMGSLNVVISDGSTWDTVWTKTGQQQTGYSDPWKKAIVDLSSFSGTIRLKFLGTRGSDYTGDMAIDEISIHQAPPCPQPTNLSVSNVTTSGADLSWTSVSAASSGYTVIYGPPGFDPSTGGTSTTASGNSISLTGLSSATHFDAYVLADCGATNGTSDTAGPVSFLTLCATYTAPYYTGFENDAIDMSPLCWESYHTYSGAFAEVKAFTGAAAPYAGSQGLYLYSSSSSTTPGTDTLLAISPQFTDLTAGDKQIRFFANSDDPTDQLIIGTLPSASGTATFTPLDTITFITPDTYEEVIIPLTTANGYNGTDEYIGLVHSLGSTIDYIRIDEFNYEVIPPCSKPTALSVAGVTTNTFTINYSGAGTTYDVEWGPSGFSQGTGCMATVSGTSPTIDNSSDPGCSIQLQPNTSYDVYVRSNCTGSGNGLSLWTGPISLRTSCASYTATYTENFDSYATPNFSACWAVLPSTSTSVLTVSTTDHGATIPSGPNALEINDIGAPMVISPEFTDLASGNNRVQVQIAFEGGGTTYEDTLFMGLMPNQVSDTSFVYLDTIIMEATDGSFQEYRYSFDDPSIVDTNLHIAFWNVSGGGGYEFYLDNFEYEPIPPCEAATSSSIGIENLTYNSASVYWGSQGTGVKTYVEVGTSGFIPGTTTYSVRDSVAGTMDTLAVTGLSPQTTYDVYIQDSCMPGGQSAWVGPFTFTTLCTPATLPFNESFSGGAFPACWSRSNTTDVTYESTCGSQAGVIQLEYTEDLTTPDVDVSGASSLKVSYMIGAGACDNDPEDYEHFHVEYWDGNQWVQAMDHDGSLPNSFVSQSFLVPPGGFSNLFKVRFNMIDGTTDSWQIDSVVIEQGPACFPPYDLTVTDVLDTSVVFDWAAGPSAATHQVWFGPLGFYQGTTTTGGFVTGFNTADSLLVDTLTPNTCYEYVVRSICSSGDTSVWEGPYSFCTPCSPVTAPYAADFDGTTEPQINSCWTVINQTSSTSSIETYDGGYPAAYSSPNVIEFYTSGASSGDLILVSPLLGDMSNSKLVKFQVYDDLYNANNLIIGTLSNPNDPATFTPYDTLLETDLPDEQWEEVRYLFSSYTGTDKYVGIKVQMGGTYDYIYIDNFRYENVTCPYPSNIQFGNSTTTSLDISWNSGGASNWQIEYGQPGFTPGTGTMLNVSTNPYTLSGLSPGTRYEVYVRDSCGAGDVSYWTGPAVDTTLCTNVLSGTYTVGGPAGPNNFADLDSLEGVLNICGVSGPVTINLMGGTHDALKLNNVPGVSATNTITFNGSGVLGDSIIANGAGAAIELNGTGHISFNNIYAENNGGTFVVWMHENAHHVSIDACELVGSRSTTSTSAVVAASGSPTSATTAGDNAHHVSITNNTIAGNYYGITIYGLSDADHNTGITIADNQLEDQYYYGIRTYYMDSVSMERNVIPAFRNTFSYGMQVYYGDQVTVAQNQVLDAGYAFYIYGVNRNAQTGTAFSNIVNNVGIGSTSGMYAYYNAYTNFHHNTLRGGTYGLYMYGSSSYSNTDIDVRNNILESSGTALYISGTEPSNLTIDYNLYYAPGGNVAYQGSTSYSSLSAWQTAYPSENVNSVSGNPLFVGANTYQVVGSLANDVGDNSIGVTVDVEGDPRPASGSTTVDIGADEYTPPTCPPVTSFVVESVQDTAAHLSWVPSSGNPGASFQIEYGVNLSSTGSGTTVMSTQDSLVLTGLTPNTSYCAFVREICSAGDSSMWIGPICFTTACTPFQAPFMENFEGHTVGFHTGVDNCWTIENSGSYEWELRNTQQTTSSGTGPDRDNTLAPSVGGKFFNADVSYGSSGDSSMLISPIVDISSLTNPELEYHIHRWGTQMADFYVDIFDGSQWINGVHAYTNQSGIQTSASDPYLDTIISLAPYIGTTNFRVRFRTVTNGCCAGDNALDDIRISDPVSCPAPSGLSQVASTTTSATVQWDTTGYSGSTFIVEYGPAGFTPGTGTQATVSGNSYTATGLTSANLCQEVYISAVCSATDTSLWAGPLSMCPEVVPCDDIDVYATGPIDPQSVLFIGWEGGSAGDAAVSTTHASSGSNSMRVTDKGPAGATDVVAYFDTVSSGVWEISFDMYVEPGAGAYYNIQQNHDITGGGNHLWAGTFYFEPNGTATVQYSASATLVGTFTYSTGQWEDLSTIIDLNNDSIWVEHNGTSTGLGWNYSAVNGPANLQFNGVDFFTGVKSGGSYDIDYYIDDFCVSPYVPSGCQAPTALAPAKEGCDSVEVSWNSVNSGYAIIEYGPAGFTPNTGAGTMLMAQSPYVISNLSVGTSYDVYVADTCGADTSAWTGPQSFATLDMPVASFSMNVGTATATDLPVSFDASGSQNATSYTWDFGDTNTAAGMNPQHAYTSNGTYFVTLVVTGDCGTDTITDTVMTQGIDFTESALGRSISMYPNPARDEVNLSFEASASTSAVIRVMEISGKEVMEIREENINGRFQSKLDISSLADGVYMVEITSGNMKAIRRLIKD